MNLLRNDKHKIFSETVRKKVRTAFDDTRYKPGGDESVKRGGGSVADLESYHTQHSGSYRVVISVSTCFIDSPFP